MIKFNIIKPETKLKARIMPFVTFPLTKKCNFKCIYCGYGGELSASMIEQQDYSVLCKRIFTAHKLGIRKFRFTGGEPFLYPQLENLIKLFNELGAYLLINTNASLIKDYSHIFKTLQDNIHFAVSFDTNISSRFDAISNSKNIYKKVREGIEIIKNAGGLLRLNMVVNKYNQDELFNIIDYCSELKCNLKLLDVVSVPLPYGNRTDLHVPFFSIEEKLNQLCESVNEHQYARSFGTPCRIYKYKGINITIKSTWNGSRYDIKGLCDGCTYFPCHEGLYDIFSLPDKRVIGCRWSEESVIKGNSFEEQLKKIAEIFQRAIYIKRIHNKPMGINPEFVINSLIKAGQEPYNIRN